MACKLNEREQKELHQAARLQAEFVVQAMMTLLVDGVRSIAFARQRMTIVKALVGEIEKALQAAEQAADQAKKGDCPTCTKIVEDATQETLARVTIMPTTEKGYAQFVPAFSKGVTS